MQCALTLVSHVGLFYDHGICQLYYVGPMNKLGIFINYSYIPVELGNVGGVILLALCKIYSSSHDYSHETMFVPMLFLEITIK